MFEVESGHMLSKHKEACRFPHGHSRRIEVVVSCGELDENDMVVDFKALKLALEGHINRLDHSLALNSEDPLLGPLSSLPNQALVIFESKDPTTEVIADDLFMFVVSLLDKGWAEVGSDLRIPAGRCKLESIKVWETSSSWAECYRD